MLVWSEEDKIKQKQAKSWNNAIWSRDAYVRYGEQYNFLPLYILS